MKRLNLFFSIFFLVTSLSNAQTDQSWINLDGTNDFLDFGTDDLLEGKTQFTLEMKIHFKSSSAPYTIIGQRNSDSNRTFVIQEFAGLYYILFNDYNYATCSFEPCQGEVYHLAVIFNGAGASTSDRLSLYIDGVPQTLSFEGSIPNSTIITTPKANLVLGCEHNGPSTQLQFFPGQFGELCVWNYPMTSTEINTRIINEVSGTETGLVEYFHFDNGIAAGNNTGITSFSGGLGVSTTTPTNMAMNGTSSNFVGQPEMINTLDTSLTVNEPVITSNETGATYQWLDCDNGFAIIQGATSQSYSAEKNGNYAVRITSDFCTKTSSCVQISALSISNLEIERIAIYPNPTMNELIIENKENNEERFFRIFNSMGQVIFSGILNEKTIVQTADWVPGNYFLKLNGEGAVQLKKIVKI